MAGSMRISQTFAKALQELGEKRILEIIEVHKKRNEWQRKHYHRVMKPKKEAERAAVKKMPPAPMKDGRQPVEAEVTK